jgi:FkbM family methyltransferase
MIVKDESHVIVKTLYNLISIFNFDYYVISDTGSTDGTQNKIKQFFEKQNINGEIYNDEWKDFGYNRTKALEHAYNKTDYLLIFDADDFIHTDYDDKFKYDYKADNKTIHAYNFRFGDLFSYKRPLLISNRHKWKFVGVLHEYLEINEKIQPKFKTIERTKTNNYYVESGKSGNRSKDKDKYKKDANILSNAFDNEKNYNLKCRYAFYCAQSYKDSNQIDKSIEWYLKVLKLDNWNQEKYHSTIQLGNLYSYKKDYHNALHYWMISIKYDNKRIEGIVKCMEHYYEKDNNIMINVLYSYFKDYDDDLKNRLFIDRSKYLSLIEYYNSISSYYIPNKHSEGYLCLKKIFEKQNLEKSKLNISVSNMNFYIQEYQKDTFENQIGLLHNLETIIRNNNFNQYGILDKLLNTIENKLTEYPKNIIDSISSNSNNPQIFLSITSCKRFNLFQKTINSFLQMADYQNINYWFVVDDNSSDEDRNHMKNKYPFFDFYFKKSKEKGHRKSMNIIYDMLVKLKPKYWIHLEDDFLFFKRTDYISICKNFLDNNNNYSQILFNRNYSEIFSDLAVKSHTIIDDNFLAHNYKIGNFPYINCHYWKDYSFRPSLINVSTILKLGNFNSNNIFFELDYANKYYNNGYRSAFMNHICCKHIGKLTGNRSDGKNSYELNNEEQFDNNDNNNNNNNNNNNKNNDNNNKFIKIINLKRRSDRKIKMIKQLDKINISNYEFHEAIDGKNINNSKFILNTFMGNDFSWRRGIIGCALSHYYLWEKLLLDKKNDYYLIMEDDCELLSNFKNALQSIDFNKHDVLFLGYSMYEKDKMKNDEYYKINNDNKIKYGKLNSIFIGGTYSYSITKSGAKKLLNYIKSNGIKHGIDYLMGKKTNICYEIKPFITKSEWNENNKKIDTDIQNNYDKINEFNFPLLKRFDFGGKISYIISKEKNINSKYLEKVYRENIYEITNRTFTENNRNDKKCFSDFIDIYDKVIDNTKNNIIDNFPIITNNNYLVEGIHRTSASIYFNKEPKYSDINDQKLYDNKNIQNVNYDYRNFKLNSDHIALTNLIYLDYNFRAIIIYPKSSNHMNNSIEKIINDYCDICYQKDIKLNKNGLSNLISELYYGESWIGKNNNNTSHKLSLTYGNNNTRLFIVNVYNDNEFLLMKQKIRNITFHDFIHTTDDKNDTYRVCSTLLNENTIKLINSKKIILSDGSYNLLNRYMKDIDEIDNGKFINRQDYCISSSFILDMYNLRSANDIDFISIDNKELKNHKCHSGIWESFYHDKNEIIYDPNNYFYWRGVKFSTLDQVKKMKENRYCKLKDKKDINDINLINSLSKYIFIKGLDQINNDTNTNNFVAYNSLGYHKSKITKLTKSNYFSPNDGIYIERKYFNSFYKSQWKQDKLLNDKFFKNNINGIFVDIGAHDGIDKSNSYFFENILNWSGICIEPNPIIFDKLKNNRSSLNLNVGCYCVEGEFDFLLNTGYTEMLSGLKNTYCKEHLNRITNEQKLNGGKSKTIKIKTSVLNDIFDKNFISIIDYLSIDTEGSEYEILLGIDFDKYHINIIDVEINYKDDKFDKIKKLLSKYFIIDSVIGGDYIFKNKNLKFSWEMKKINLICDWTITKNVTKEFCLMINKYFYDNLMIDFNNPDYNIIINKTNQNIDKSKSILLQMEPYVYDQNKNWGVSSWGKWKSPDGFLKLFDKRELNTCQWHIDLNLTNKLLQTMNKINKCITILSKKNYDDGHKYRINLSRKLDNNLLDVYGRRNYHYLNNYISELENDKKEYGYCKYKYMIAVENNKEQNYLTEKFYEGILCECLVFYWGCPNISDYINPECFIQLNDDYDSSIKIISDAIKNNEYEKRIHKIKNEKNKIINKLAFFPKINKIINKLNL